jgi:hypothetical protein
MKLFNQFLKPAILLSLLAQVVLIQATLAAEIGVSGGGSTSFECKLGYCQCKGGSASSDCKRMMINCTDINGFGCYDAINCPPELARDFDGCLKKNPNGDLCMCKTASDESTNPIVREHRRPKIDNNSSNKAEIIAPNNRTGTVRVIRARPNSSPVVNAPGLNVIDHR